MIMTDQGREAMAFASVVRFASAFMTDGLWLTRSVRHGFPEELDLLLLEDAWMDVIS